MPNLSFFERLRGGHAAQRLEQWTHRHATRGRGHCRIAKLRATANSAIPIRGTGAGTHSRLQSRRVRQRVDRGRRGSRC